MSSIFDQPLWLKALEIITAKKLHIVPARFHMFMSFYDSIGTIVARSGIHNLFQKDNEIKKVPGRLFSSGKLDWIILTTPYELWMM